MSTPTAYEQSLMEMINRARADPEGEFDLLIADAETQTATDPRVTSAIRFFDVDLGVLADQLSGLPSAAPLAWNIHLSEAAAFHSSKLIEHDVQSHNINGEPGLMERIQNAGYQPMFISENIFAYAESDVYTHAGFYIDWGFTDTGIQTGAGHRVNILNPGVTEMGISALAENDPNTSVGPYVVTQNFGRSFEPEVFLLGVVTDDSDGDGQYDIGEGLGGITVTIRADGQEDVVTQTWTSGGYQVALEPGTYDVTFSDGTLDGVVTKTIEMGDDNVKLDAEASEAVAPPPVNLAPVLNVSATVTSIAENALETIAAFSVVDPEGDEITLILDGPDAGLFALDRGTLRLETPADFETPLDSDGDNVLDVTLAAVDSTGNATSQAFLVNVTDVDETPPGSDVGDPPVTPVAQPQEPNEPASSPEPADETEEPVAPEDAPTTEVPAEDPPAPEADPEPDRTDAPDVTVENTPDEPSTRDPVIEDPKAEAPEVEEPRVEAPSEPEPTPEEPPKDEPVADGSEGEDTPMPNVADEDGSSEPESPPTDIAGDAPEDDGQPVEDSSDQSEETAEDPSPADPEPEPEPTPVVEEQSGPEPETTGSPQADAPPETPEPTPQATPPESLNIAGSSGDDNLSGTSGADTISAGFGNDSVMAGAGNDLLSGSEGDDTLMGEAGHDRIGGGTGRDSILGGEGDDVVGAGLGNDHVSGGAGHDVLNGGGGDDTIHGDHGHDVSGAGFDHDLVFGGQGDDSLGGGTGRDTLHGEAGDDQIGGGEGDDVVNGGGGDDFLAGGGRHDVLNGGGGQDRLNGGGGNDTLSGGADADIFVFKTFSAGEVDRITDFRVGVDHLHLTGIENQPGTGVAGKVAALDITDTESGARLRYDDHTILLEGVEASDLGTGDFIFV